MWQWLTRFRAVTLGQRGERDAAKHLRRQDYRILARNLRSRAGEVDILTEAPDRRTVVIVEVKAGTNGALPPEVHVNRAKQRKLTQLAAGLVRQYGLANRPIRFDVIAVDFPRCGKPAIRHHVGAFQSHV